MYGFRRTSAPSETANDPAYPPDGTYSLWIEQFDTLDVATLAAISERLARLPHQPSISVIVPVFDPPPNLLRAAIESVRRQLYTNGRCASRTTARQTLMWLRSWTSMRPWTLVSPWRSAMSTTIFLPHPTRLCRS